MSPLPRWGTRRTVPAAAEICFASLPAAAASAAGLGIPIVRGDGLDQLAMQSAARVLTIGASRDALADPHARVPVEPSHGLDPQGIAYAGSVGTTHTNDVPWLHIFPDGQVHTNPHPYELTNDPDRRGEAHEAPLLARARLRWGVGKLMLEAPENPLVLPIWLRGTGSLFRHRLDIVVGEPVDMSADRAAFRAAVTPSRPPPPSAFHHHTSPIGARPFYSAATERLQDALLKTAQV